MWDAYQRIPVTSRAAQAELERQSARRLSAAGDASEGEQKKKPKPSKGEGQKHAVQPKPEDQRGRPDPKEVGR